MFCGNCGAPINEGQKFCPNCGAQIQQEKVPEPAGADYGQQAASEGYVQPAGTEYQQGAAQNPKKNSNVAVIIVCIILGAVVLIAAATGIFLGIKFFGKEAGKDFSLPFTEKESVYTDPLDVLIEGLEQQDGDALMSAFSEGTIGVLEEQSGYTREEIADLFEELFVGAMGEMQVEPGAYQVDYEIVQTEEITGSDLDDIREEYNEYVTDEEIEEAKKLEIHLKVGIEALSDETYEDTLEIQVIRINGKWYIDPTTM